MFYTVKCPRGYFYDTNTKTCEPCQIGYISKAEGSMQCEACPANSSTLEVGSKVCTGKLIWLGIFAINSLVCTAGLFVQFRK